MAVKALIWDLGGVLLRTEDRAPRAALAARFGRTASELEYLVFNSPIGLQAQLGEISAAHLWDFIGRELGVPAEDLPAVEAAFWEGDRLDGALVEKVRGFRGRFKTALLSNAWDDLREALENTWQIAGAFDHLVISAEVGIVKPDARIYRLALDAMRVKAGEAIFLDDFLENVNGARAVGMQAIHFQSPGQALSELEERLNQRRSP